jgi:hypothetical protein
MRRTGRKIVNRNRRLFIVADVDLKRRRLRSPLEGEADASRIKADGIGSASRLEAPVRFLLRKRINGTSGKKGEQ